jgi:hypothetical protein
MILIMAFGVAIGELLMLATPASPHELFALEDKLATSLQIAVTSFANQPRECMAELVRDLEVSTAVVTHVSDLARILNAMRDNDDRTFVQAELLKRAQFARYSLAGHRGSINTTTVLCSRSAKVVAQGRAAIELIELIHSELTRAPFSSPRLMFPPLPPLIDDVAR